MSQLKKHVGPKAIPSPNLPLVDSEGRIKFNPVSVISTRALPRNHVLVTQWLVQWEGFPPDDATWEDADFIKSTFPEFYRSTIKAWFPNSNT